jgi:hypothetical protein
MVIILSLLSLFSPFLEPLGVFGAREEEVSEGMDVVLFVFVLRLTDLELLRLPVLGFVPVGDAFAAGYPNVDLLCGGDWIS